jgi:hypothetical protein
MDEGHVIDTFGEMREQATDPFAAFAMLLPIPGALHDGAGIALKEFDFAAGIELLAVTLDEFGFVIKRVALAGGTGHEELHDALGLGGMMHAWLCAKQAFLAQKMSKSDAA